MTKRITLATIMYLGLFVGAAIAGDDEEAPAPPTDAPECRALDADGKTIAKASDKSSVKCGMALMDNVRAAKCITADMIGKKVEYTVQADHMIGQTKLKDRETWLTCVTLKPAT